MRRLLHCCRDARGECPYLGQVENPSLCGACTSWHRVQVLLDFERRISRHYGNRKMQADIHQHQALGFEVPARDECGSKTKKRLKFLNHAPDRNCRAAFKCVGKQCRNNLPRLSRTTNRCRRDCPLSLHFNLLVGSGRGESPASHAPQLRRGPLQSCRLDPPLFHGGRSSPQ